MKMFNKILMASEQENNMLKTGYYQVSGADATVEDGALVEIGDLRQNELYSALKDMNARNCVAPTASTKIYGLVDYVGVSHADVMGVNYRIGDKIAGCYPEAGESFRVRMLALGDEFYLGDENFASTPTIGGYAVPKTGETKFAVAADGATISGLTIKVEDSRDLIMGAKNEGSKLYRCRVINL